MGCVNTTQAYRKWQSVVVRRNNGPILEELADKHIWG
jgi:hypothetical protein